MSEEFNQSFLEKIIQLSADKKNQLIRFVSELFKSDLVLIKEIIIENPPTDYTIYYKKLKYDKKGNLIKYVRYYLTGNLFYSNSGSIHTVRKIVYETKEYLFPYLKGLPELEKLRLEFEYYDVKDVDLDNRASFWIKIFMDILKTPTSRQLLRASKEKNPKPIITTNTISDDDTKCIDEIKLKYVNGERKIIFRIYGRAKSQQKTLEF